MVERLFDISIGIVSFFAKQTNENNKRGVDIMLQTIEKAKIEYEKTTETNRSTLLDEYYKNPAILTTDDFITTMDIKDDQFVKLLNTLFYYEWLKNSESKTIKNLKDIKDIWLSRYKKYFPEKEEELDKFLSSTLDSESMRDILNNLLNMGVTVGSVGVFLMMILPALGVGVGLFGTISIFLFGIPGGQVFSGVILIALLGFLGTIDIKGKHHTILSEYLKKQLDPDLDLIAGK